jgi:hypothetical protein
MDATTERIKTICRGLPQTHMGKRTNKRGGRTVPEVTKLQIWEFLNNSGSQYATYQEFVDNNIEPEEVTLDEATFNILRSCDLKTIIAGSEMSEDHLGGDDLVSVADDVMAAIKEGYAVTTWYGHNSEALVAGYRPGQLSVKERAIGRRGSPRSRRSS